MGSRYIRFLVIAILCMIGLLFFSSSNRLPSSISSIPSSFTGLTYAESKQPQAPSHPPPPPQSPPSKPTTPKPPSSNAVTPKSQPFSYQDYASIATMYNSTRANATFVTLARNSDIWDLARSIRQIEDRFNRKFNYDWVFLNDAEFDDTFKRITTALVSGTTKYGKIPTEHWSYPEWTDQKKAADVRQDMRERKIIYGDSESYRHMCRYESGFFYRHPLMLDYEWYWRVEPGIEIFCDIDYDAFKFMANSGKKYSFVLSLYEYVETIPTLWENVKTFMTKYPQHIAQDNSMRFLSDDGGNEYNYCHFWSNFEIGSLNWLRSQAYADYFDHLDKSNGFFYERWGDAPVHSIAAALMLKKEEIHFFNNIAYYHVPFTHCPTGEQLRLDLKCHCKPQENFDWKGYSCLTRFFDLNDMQKPAGAELEGDNPPPVTPSSSSTRSRFFRTPSLFSSLIMLSIVFMVAMYIGLAQRLKLSSKG